MHLTRTHPGLDFLGMRGIHIKDVRQRLAVTERQIF